MWLRLRLRLARFRPVAFVLLLCSLKPKELLSLKFTESYLTSRFTLAQRIRCAIAHYTFEGKHYGAKYHRAVHQSPEGLLLWHRIVDGTRYAITLCATEDKRREGDLSVLCFVNGTRVCRLAFTYINGGMFGLDSRRTMFVARSQADRNAELQRFRDTFKQNSPPYFCLAAVCGIAMANGMPAILLVKHDAQIAFAEQYAESFKNSYSRLWESFGAEEIEHRQAYVMSLPPKFKPLTGMKHRTRAIARRRNWLEIALSARQALLADRISAAPPPVDATAHEPLPQPANATATAKANRSTEAQKPRADAVMELEFANDAEPQYDKPTSAHPRRW
jgi:uncharacterized protein VirK/YbjX